MGSLPTFPVINLRNIVTGITLATDEDFLVVQTEGVDKVFEETEEISSHHFFIGVHSPVTLGKASADGLLNPHHIGEVDPRIRVRYRLECTILP